MTAHLTETGNATLLISTYGDTLRYCPPMNTWFVWNGKRWAQDTTGELYRKAQSIANTHRETASKLGTGDMNTAKLLRWANTSESLRGIQSMIKLAQKADDICVDTDAFDRNPMLLNVDNGTIDLDSGKFERFNPDDMITITAPVTFVREATSTIWARFLEQVLPDPTTRDFIQAAVGYSLTGYTREDKLFMLHGSGRNGKTTFLGTILNMLGGYGAQASSKILVAKRDGGPSNELFVLIGKRFVTASETGETHKLDEELIKQITGGDRISINPKYMSQIEFTPTWKTWFSTNHVPIIAGTDTAIWSRIVKIPFSVTLSGSRCDPALKPLLFGSREERSGILNWALEGVEMWKESGLEFSQEIMDSTKFYRASQDLTGQFLAECCQIHPNLMIAKSKLYDVYFNFCRKMNDKPKGKNAFGRDLHERGMKDSRRVNSRYWVGINTNNSVSLLPCDAV